MENVEKKEVLEKKSEEILSNKSFAECYFIYNDGRKEKRRLFKNSWAGVCVFNKGSKKFGQKLSYYIDYLQDIKEIKKKEKTDNERWIYGMLKIKEKLEKSGLWRDVLQDVNLCLEIGYEKLQEAYKRYDEAYSLSYDEAIRYRIEKIKEIDERLVGINDEGKEYVKSIVWEYSHIPKIKKMYFGKFRNDEILKEIKEALENRKEIRVSERASYDVSFSYNPQLNSAWYSEEYRNCGNGHYYIALDNEYALFVEDD